MYIVSGAITVSLVSHQNAAVNTFKVIEIFLLCCLVLHLTYIPIRLASYITAEKFLTIFHTYEKVQAT